MSVNREKISKDKQGLIDRFGQYPRHLQLLFLRDADKSFQKIPQPGRGQPDNCLSPKFSKICSVVRCSQGCSWVGTAFLHLFALTRTASQKSTVKEEDLVWKFLLAGVHFIRTIWCSLPFI